MGIVFFCQSCGARFEVDSRMAGKKGRCKKCGQMMSIPRAEDLSSMTAMAVPAAAGAGAAVAVGAGAGAVSAKGAGAGAGGSSIGSWLKGGISKVALAPITVDRMPIGQKRPYLPSALDDAEDSKPYVLAQPVVENRGRVKQQANVVVALWRRQLGKVQKLFRNINQTAYLISVPCILLFLLGIAVGSHQMTMLGVTGIVLLNIVRLAAGSANLAVVPFRDGLNFNKMKKPLWRVIEPVLTIGLVVLGFVFIPFLSKGTPAKGSFTDRLRAGAETVEQEVKGGVDKGIEEVKGLHVDKLGQQAQDQFKGLVEKAKGLDLEKLGQQAQDKLKGLRSTSGGQQPARPGFGESLKALEKKTQEELDKAKALNELNKNP
jgi:hypothetical protein